MLKTNLKNTAILIFANTSTEEVKRKKIVNGHDVFEHLNQKIYHEAKKTGLDVIFYSEEHQKGNSFGERFSNAIKHVFSEGYNHVITVGNDSPDLKARHLTIAQNNLDDNTLTVGPSLDGGTYLITLSKKEFNEQEFAKLPWQTSKLLATLQKHLVAKNENIQQLEFLKDVDNLTDLKYFLSRFNGIDTILKKLILDLISLVKKIVLSITHGYKEHQHIAYYNKGSPILH